MVQKSVHMLRERIRLTFGLLPTTGLETAIGIDEQIVGVDEGEHVLDPVLDLLLSGNTGRVDVVDAGTDLVGVTELLEGGQKLHVALGSLNGNDVGV